MLQPESRTSHKLKKKSYQWIRLQSYYFNNEISSCFWSSLPTDLWNHQENERKQRLQDKIKDDGFAYDPSLSSSRMMTGYIFVRGFERDTGIQSCSWSCAREKGEIEECEHQTRILVEIVSVRFHVQTISIDRVITCFLQRLV